MDFREVSYICPFITNKKIKQKIEIAMDTLWLLSNWKHEKTSGFKSGHPYNKKQWYNTHSGVISAPSAHSPYWDKDNLRLKYVLTNEMIKSKW